MGYQFVPEAMRYLPDDRYFRHWSGGPEGVGLGLAPRFGSGAEYSDAKTDFIRAALAAALRP